MRYPPPFPKHGGLPLQTHRLPPLPKHGGLRLQTHRLPSLPKHGGPRLQNHSRWVAAGPWPDSSSSASPYKRCVIFIEDIDEELEVSSVTQSCTNIEDDNE